MTRFKFVFRFFLSFIFMLSVSEPQNKKEEGMPLITTYGIKEHGGLFQNWAFIQDDRGVMYIGNGVGVLEFDGSDWRIIKTTNNSFVRSLGKDESGRIYVGGSAEFGYLIPDENGIMRYESLLEYVNKEDKIFSYVWTTISTPDGIYFQTRERIFRFSKDGSDASSEGNWEVKVWKPKKTFDYAFWINGTYFVKQGQGGILKMSEDSLRLVPGSEQFSDDRMQVMLPFGSKNNLGYADTLLLGTFNRGLFLFVKEKFIPYKTNADEFLISGTLYDGKVLINGAYALATLDRGMVIIDKHGDIINILDKTTGIPDNSVSAIYVDREGKLWVGPDNGICIVETPSPLTRHAPASGLIAASNRITRHNGLLYIASQDGVFFIDHETSEIRPVTGFGAGTTQTFHLLTVGNELLAAVNIGLYKIVGDKAFVIKQATGLTFSPQWIHHSKTDSDRIFLGLFDGLASLKKRGDQWLYEGKIDGILTYVSGIIENSPGKLWLASYDYGVIKVEFNGNSLENPVIEHYDSFDGKTKIGGTQVLMVADHTIFVTKDGIFNFNEEYKKFEKDPIFKDLQTSNFSADQMAMTEDKSGNIWFMVDKNRVILRPQPDGSYKIDRTILERFADELINNVYVEDDGVVWFTVNDGIVRYDTNYEVDFNFKYPALLRKISTGEGEIIFGGTDFKDGLSVKELSFENNALRFEFAATSFTNPHATKFRSFLEGFDDHWSSWTTERVRIYTNLPPGDYKFHVTAENIYHQPSSQAEYSFKILPPWYRTIWAYGFYFILLAIVIFGIDRVQRKRLLKIEREKSQLREAKLRASEAEAKTLAAEAQAQALQVENEQKKNVELLSEIGKTITASLSIKNIMTTVYKNVNDLMDATVFGIGLFDQETKRIHFPWTIEKGEALEPFYYSLEDENRPAASCFNKQQEIVMNDYEKEYPKYFGELKDAVAGDNPSSMIYLPLTFQKKKIGVITAQSFSKDAYTDYHLNILRNLATYAAIALDNANTYRQLNKTIEELNKTLDNLKTTQEQLVVQEKLASLGQLTAGIAHEIKNPLNFVNNFAELSSKIVDSLSNNITALKDNPDESLYSDIEEDLLKLGQLNNKINEHGKRADSIVKSMMAHARSGKGDKVSTDINSLLDESYNLVYHGLRARQSGFNISIEKTYDKNIQPIEIVSQDISRVFLNIIGNACYAAYKRNRDDGTSPSLHLTTADLGSRVEIRIRDNGSGIPKEIQEKIFNPFFTTKPAGEGTGLGLSISHDIIVKMHDGELRVESEPGVYTEFVIVLPK